MKKTLLSLSILSLGIISYAQVGVGTNTPQSTLTVEGSLETGYKEVTATTTLSANDYYVTYNGAMAATVTMPTVGSGATSFTGRIYKIKNISNNTVTVAGAGSDTFRNSGNAVSTLTLTPGQYVEVVNNGNTTGGATWDVSSINIPTPPTNAWQFDNIYDYTAIDKIEYTSTSSTTPYFVGFSQPITIPANKQAKIVLSYSIPVGHQGTASGYYGVTLKRKIDTNPETELPSGSRKYTQIAPNGAWSMTTVGASVADSYSSQTTSRTITYSLYPYLENNTAVTRFLMFDKADPNFNWGRGYWSITVYLK